MTALGWEVGEAVPCHTGGNLRTRSLPAPQSQARGTAASRHTLLSGNLPPEPAHAATGDPPPPGEQHGRPEPTSVPHVRPPRWPPHSGSQGRRRTGPRALPSSPARPQGWRHQAWGVPSPRPPPPGPGRAAPRASGPSACLSVVFAVCAETGAELDVPRTNAPTTQGHPSLRVPRCSRTLRCRPADQTTRSGADGRPGRQDVHCGRKPGPPRPARSWRGARPPRAA